MKDGATRARGNEGNKSGPPLMLSNPRLPETPRKRGRRRQLTRARRLRGEMTTAAADGEGASVRATRTKVPAPLPVALAPPQLYTHHVSRTPHERHPCSRGVLGRPRGRAGHQERGGDLSSSPSLLLQLCPSSVHLANVVRVSIDTAVRVCEVSSRCGGTGERRGLVVFVSFPAAPALSRQPRLHLTNIARASIDAAVRVREVSWGRRARQQERGGGCCS